MLTSMDRANSQRFQALGINLYNLAQESETAAEILILIAFLLTDQSFVAWSYVKKRIRTPFKKTYNPCDLFDPVDMHPLNDAVEIHTNGFEC